MPSKNSIDDVDATSTAAAADTHPPSTGRRPPLRSDGSPPAPVIRGTQDVAQPHVPPPPPAPDEQVDTSDNEGSPPLLSDPEDADFTFRGSTRKNAIFSNSLWTNSEYPNSLKSMSIWSL